MEPSPTRMSQESSRNGGTSQSPHTIARLPLRLPGQTLRAMGKDVSSPVNQVPEGQRIRAMAGVAPSNNARGEATCRDAHHSATAHSRSATSSSEGRRGGPSLE
jgi:hypothetical protein